MSGDPRKWAQAAEAVVHRITAGELGLGDMITAAGLARARRVTRHTARHALRALEERVIVTADGTRGFMILIDRVPDEGTPGNGCGPGSETAEHNGGKADAHQRQR